MVTSRRSFQGTLSIDVMPRLCEMLAAPEGTAVYELDFGRDELGVAWLDVRAKAPLTLICQRSLEPFVLPVAVESRLGLIRHEHEEAALPPGYEPLLVAEDGKLNPLEVIEDELLLALPLVPVNPDSAVPDEVTSPEPEIDSGARTDNPFAVLRELKK